MRRNSIEAQHEANHLDECYEASISDVKAASKLLQHAMAIDEGTTYLDAIAVRTHRLPTAPEQPKRRSNFALLPTPPPSGQIPALSQAGLQLPSLSDLGVTPVDGTGDGDIMETFHDALEVQETASLLPPLTNKDHPASPPFNYAEGLSAEEEELLPVYWDMHLSKNLYAWLEYPDTRSTQHELIYVDLRGQGEVSLELKFEAKDCERMKPTHLLLPTLPHMKDEREWIIIEVQLCGGDSTSDSYDDFDDEEPAVPYWLLAFPTSAVIASQSIMSQDGQHKNTTWTMGESQCLPTVHGRGVPRRFAHKFMCACAKGHAVIEMGFAAESSNSSAMCMRRGGVAVQITRNA